MIIFILYKGGVIVKDFFLFFPILIIAWLCYGVKHIYEIVTQKHISVRPEGRSRIAGESK